MMGRLFQKKPVCFYCGIRSAQNHPSNIRQWQCEKCEAQNYLDEQGQITDPPPLDNVSGARFARSVPRPASPEFASIDEPRFCPVCEHNQMMVTNILASDTKHEDNLVEYRRDLETRYPQVCNQCEPRVREQIRASGYAAKTDHLRRMMERTRGERGLGRWNWKSIVISLGAIGWYISLAGQLLWDVQQVVAAHRQETVGEDDLSSISTCPSSSWAISLITSKCSTNYDSAADLALDLGLFCIWWNPRLKEKSTKGGRIVGKAGYYGLQIMLHVLRSASSSVLRSPAYDFDARTVKAAHSLMFVITTVLTIVSLRSIQLDSSPRVLFRESPDSLGHNAQHGEADSYNVPSNSQRQPNSYATQASANRRPFSINDLAPSRPYQAPYNPPTPPPDDDDDEAEAMDWTPSQQSLPPMPLYRQPKSTRVEPSPFHGRLPQTPKSQAHKLRNPNQPTFQKASSAQKQNFFKRPQRQSDQDEVSELGSDTESVSTRINGSKLSSPQFAPPKFFPVSDFLQDTGLESIFSKAFSIAEEPSELSSTRERRVQSNYSPHPTPILQIFCVLFLLFSILAWWYATRTPGLVTFLRFASLGVAATVAGRGLLQCIQRNEDHWSWIGMLFYTSELCFATVLGGVVKMQFTAADANGLRLVGLGLLGFMVVQESWIIVSTMSNGPKLRPSNPLSIPDGSQTPKPQAKPPSSKSSDTADTRLSRTSPTPSTSSSEFSTRHSQQSSVPPSLSGRTTRSSRSRLVNSPSSSGFGGLSLG